MDGILNICKPEGLTSFEIVRKVRKILKVKKVGHCGTLDPLASGVLVIVFGQATKMAATLSAEDKIYKAMVRLGIKTDSGDITGKVLEESSVPELQREEVHLALQNFMGITEQIPPMVSALKYGGRRLYHLAREGVIVERSPRSIEIKSIELLSLSPSQIEFRVHCSKGTYVRTLAEDLGQALNVPATLEALVREKSGNFELSASIPWEQVITSSQDSLLAKSLTLSPS